MLDTIVLESLERSLLNKQIIDKRDRSVGQIYEIGFDHQGIYLGTRYGTKNRKIRSATFKNYDILDDPAPSSRQ